MDIFSCDLRKYLTFKPVVTGGLIFRLHNSFTAFLLFLGSLLLTGTQYVGEPIECITSSSAVNTFCWVMSTFTLPHTDQREVPYPGMGNDFGREKKYHNYYQWVVYVLFLQGVLCYLPQWLWNNWEARVMETLSDGLAFGFGNPYEIKRSKRNVKRFLSKKVNCVQFYTLKYMFCEFLCLINILCQLFAMNKFFDGQFLTYGLDVLSFTELPQEQRIDPMVFIFPRITKCTFQKYGPSGSLQTEDILCILPLNAVNEKTYLFIWFWFLILLAALIILLVYRLCIIIFPCARVLALRVKCPGMSKLTAASLSKKLGFQRWWIIYLLEKNISPVHFIDLMDELSIKLDSVDITDGQSSEELEYELDSIYETDGQNSAEVDDELDSIYETAGQHTVHLDDELVSIYVTDEQVSEQLEDQGKKDKKENVIEIEEVAALQGEV